MTDLAEAAVARRIGLASAPLPDVPVTFTVTDGSLKLAIVPTIQTALFESL